MERVTITWGKTINLTGLYFFITSFYDFEFLLFYFFRQSLRSYFLFGDSKSVRSYACCCPFVYHVRGILGMMM